VRNAECGIKTERGSGEIEFRIRFGFRISNFGFECAFDSAFRIRFRIPHSAFDSAFRIPHSAFLSWAVTAMKLSLRWLRQYIGPELDVPAIIDTLTNAGIEVEGVADLGMVSGKIVVAKVLEVAGHPNADKLRVCKVDTGVGEPATIVCGAPNVTAGCFYACALPGAVMPDGMEIQKAKIRGQASEGMLCSARELGLGADHGGIMPLPDIYKIGEPFDAVLDLKVTPNRPDWLSVVGIARELGAMTGRQVFPAKPRFQETLERIEGYVQLSVTARGECPRYCCRLMRGVKVAESPLWLRRALEVCGLRPINNVVDVTNYVLMELGHPLHAFDFKRIKEGRIVVRLARQDEPIVLIDGSEIKLDAEDLVIADAQHPVALAGVMGGRDSEVTGESHEVLLEAAYFEPATVRKTARRHGLQTDASYRFERGADRERMTMALGRAAQMIQEIAGGEIIKGTLDLQTTIVEPSPLALEIGRVNRLLGVNLTSTEVADHLVSLGFEIRRADGEKLVVTAPSHRVDIVRDVDLIEEVARLFGYNNIPLTLTRIDAPPLPPAAPGRLADRTLDSLVALGFNEAMTYSFIGETQAAAVGFETRTLPRISNPLSADQVLMRPSLLPGLLTVAAANQKQDEARIQICEIGKVWLPGAVAGDPAGERPEAALVWTGPTPLHWSGGARDIDFHDMKGAIEALVAVWGDAPLVSEPLTDAATFHPGRAARLIWKGSAIGEAGELHPDLAMAFDLKGRVIAARIDLAAVLERWEHGRPAIKPVPRFPGSWRDLAIVIAADTPAGAVLEAVRTAGGALLEHAAVFDVYEGQHVAAGHKSLALRLWLRSIERTLTEEEIQAAVDKVMARLARDFRAHLRN
jgi:phenylalanyl-tRNA synthetase beta chain